MKTKHGKASIVILLLIIVVLNILAVVWFNNLVFRELESSAQSSLEDMASEQSRAISLIVTNKQDNVKGIVDVITYIGNDPETLFSSMEIWIEEYEIETLIITDTNGHGITSTGRTADISSEPYVAAVTQGEIVLTDVYTSNFTGSTVLAVTAPIYYEGRVQGIIVAEYDVYELANLLISTTDSRGSSMIVNSHGDILVHTYPFPISFENFRTASFEDGLTYEDILSDFENGTPGEVEFSISGDKKMGRYIPLGIEDWSLFFEISEASLNNSGNTITIGMLIISVSLLLAFTVLIFYILKLRSKSIKEIEKTAYYDELTGVSNLVKFKMDLEKILKQKDFNSSNYCLVKGDVENFKVINEVYGIKVGDKVICEIARLAKRIGGEPLEIARTGSDEFLVFADKDKVNEFFMKRQQYSDAIKTAVPEIKKHVLKYRYGRYFLSSAETDVDDMINKVSIAHSYARSKSGWALWNYDEKFTSHMLRMTELTNKMEDALKHNEFKMFLQPKYAPKTGELVGAEALVRWFERNGSVIYPGEFIPLFEKNEFIITLDEFIFDSACSFIAKHLQERKKCIPISVNFSRRHLQNPKFVERLCEIAQRHNTPTSYLEIELTETTVIENMDILSQVVHDLHSAGFHVSIDDFGSGYSSLGMLKHSQFDIVKLDRSFFIYEDEKERAAAETVLRGIINLVTSVGSRIVAEGIELEEQVEFLRTVDCYSIQGYYYAKPMCTDDFEHLLNT